MRHLVMLLGLLAARSSLADCKPPPGEVTSCNVFENGEVVDKTEKHVQSVFGPPTCKVQMKCGENLLFPCHAWGYKRSDRFIYVTFRRGRVGGLWRGTACVVVRNGGRSPKP